MNPKLSLGDDGSVWELQAPLTGVYTGPGVCIHSPPRCATGHSRSKQEAQLLQR